MRLDTKVTQYPGIVSDSGTYVIRSVKGPQETRFGPALILTVTDPKNREGSLFVPYSNETSKNTNLARLIAAFGTDTEKWIDKKIRVTIDRRASAESTQQLGVGRTAYRNLPSG